MQFVMSFVGGLMLGVALLHLLPHALGSHISTDQAAGWTLGGLLVMFLLIRVFHVHAHEHGDTGDVSDVHRHDHDDAGHADHHHHAGPCEHQHDQPAADHIHHHPFSWLGLAFGLSLHTLIDGLALGAAVAAEARGQHGWALFGLGTFLAVALHKPLDALSITSLMAAGGWSRGAIWIANLAFAVMCPLGALGFLLGARTLMEEQTVVVGCALAFAAGVFLCISLADLLPEVAFHAHDRLQLTLALALGVALAWGIGFFHPAHSHGPGGSHEHGRVIESGARPLGAPAHLAQHNNRRVFPGYFAMVRSSPTAAQPAPQALEVGVGFDLLFVFVPLTSHEPSACCVLTSSRWARAIEGSPFGWPTWSRT
jgi:zinc and cadmium transporter